MQWWGTCEQSIWTRRELLTNVLSVAEIFGLKHIMLFRRRKKLENNTINHVIASIASHNTFYNNLLIIFYQYSDRQ